MAGKLTIVPMEGTDRFQVLGSKGNTFLNARGYGYKSKQSAYRGLVFFIHQCNSKKNEKKIQQ